MPPTEHCQIRWNHKFDDHSYLSPHLYAVKRFVLVRATLDFPQQLGFLLRVENGRSSALGNISILIHSASCTLVRAPRDSQRLDDLRNLLSRFVYNANRLGGGGQVSNVWRIVLCRFH